MHASRQLWPLRIFLSRTRRARSQTLEMVLARPWLSPDAQPRSPGPQPPMKVVLASGDVLSAQVNSLLPEDK